MAKTIAAYGGGFKPPTRGHFEIVKNAIQEFPEIDEFIIYVGSKERDGIDQAEAILIWEIYENYLPNKVQIKSSQSPIGDILRLAKDNPQDEIYFVIGYREGRDDDMKDVASRTSNLEEKYPNIEVKVMPTFDPNMSGTNARKAINDEEEFIKFLPFEVKEKSQIWNIVRPVGAETLNENATYSQNIDYMQMISDLTNHMIAQGRNIQPLPKLEFIDGDSENAKNFFGRTAYYDPNTFTIVLYTEGRHPKDIVRSYAHEMVHHTQNLEGRIGNIQTTDTTQDEDLDAIEREAYTEGNMMFRNWTDSIDGDISTEITEGKYDSLVTKLAGFTLNAWKGDFEDGQNKGKFEIVVGPGEEFDYPSLRFKYIAVATFWDAYRSRGVARPMKDLPEVELDYWIDVEELPEKWEKISMDLRNVIRHELEHLMQSGPNAKKGKEMAPDRAERDEINKVSKKPWWKIWRKTLGSPDYYKLEKEIDANLQGLYLQAKKSRQPLEDVVDSYLTSYLKLSDKDVKDIKALWKERAPKLNIPLEEGRKPKKDPKKGTGKKPEGSKRRLYTDEDPKDTVGVKFSTRQDIVDTLNKKSFKAKSHARQSQIINLIHQRVRAALARTKDPAKKKKLKSGFEYIKKRKEASKAKTQRLKKQKNEIKGFGNRSRYRAIEKRGDKFYYIQDNPFSPGIRQEFGPYKTKAAAKKKMDSFPPSNNYRDLTEEELNEKLCKRGEKYIAKRKREGEKHNPFLSARAVKVCKGQMSGTDGKQKKDFRPSKGKKRSAQGRKPDIVKEIGINLSNYDGQILPGDVLRAPKGFPLGGKKLEKSLQLKVIKNSREGVNRYKLTLEDSNGKKYSVRNFEMDGEYKGKKLPKWGLVRKSKKNIDEDKDYFGLNKLIREIVEEPKYKIFSDMDGVLTDFEGRFEKYSDGMKPADYEKKFGKDKFWELVDAQGVAFWVGMPWMPDGEQYWDYIKDYDTQLLSSPSRSNTSRLGKRLWVRNNMPGVKLTLAQAALKQNYAAANHILIDDRKSNIDQWRSQGGIGILHTSAADTIRQLKKLGL